MKHEIQEHIRYGFKDLNGNTWADGWVDSYNELTSMVNRSAGREFASDSLTAQERNFFLDQRHRFYVTVMNIAANRHQPE